MNNLVRTNYFKEITMHVYMLCKGYRRNEYQVEQVFTSMKSLKEHLLDTTLVSGRRVLDLREEDFIPYRNHWRWIIQPDTIWVMKWEVAGKG